MRVLMVLVALVATPVLVGVAQDLGQSATKAADAGRCATADEHRSPSLWENSGQPDDKKGRDRVGCAPVAPAPVCGVAPAAGTSSISGWALLGQEPFGGIAGWCVTLSGAASGSAGTDGSGKYVFGSVPSGTYLVCLAVPPGWTQTSPSSGTLCPAGPDGRAFYGRKFTLFEGDGAGFVNFRAVPQ